MINKVRIGWTLYALYWTCLVADLTLNPDSWWLLGAAIGFGFTGITLLLTVRGGRRKAAGKRDTGLSANDRGCPTCGAAAGVVCEPGCECGPSFGYDTDWPCTNCGVKPGEPCKQDCAGQL